MRQPRRGGDRRRRLVATSLVAALALASCGGGDGDTPAARSETTGQVSTRPLTDADATAALLTLEDLPPGWSARPTPVDRAGGFCREFDVTAQVPPTGRARVQFETGSSYLNHVVAVYRAPADARRRMAIVREGVKRCRRYATEGLTLDLVGAPFPELGDETVAVKGTGQAVDLPVSVDLVFTRVGRVVTVLVHLYGDGLVGFRLERPAFEGVARRFEAKAKVLG